MKLLTAVECRAITRCRIQLGDPSKDVYEFHAYTFLRQEDFRLEMYAWGPANDAARFISRKPDVMELGAQYLLELNDTGGIAGLIVRNCGRGPRGDWFANLKADGESSNEWWCCTHMTITSDKELPLKVEQTVYFREA